MRHSQGSLKWQIAVQLQAYMKDHIQTVYTVNQDRWLIHKLKKIYFEKFTSKSYFKRRLTYWLRCSKFAWSTKSWSVLTGSIPEKTSSRSPGSRRYRLRRSLEQDNFHLRHNWRFQWSTERSVVHYLDQWPILNHQPYCLMDHSSADCCSWLRLG